MSAILYFKELMIRNFLSFGQNENIIVLSEPGTISVEGVNLDQGGSNGSGKTTIINAICYALFNKPFDNISLQRLINSTNATKNTLMEVRLTFEKSGDEYEVHRTRGEQYNIRITKNGEDITPGKGVTECDALIEDIIGISYELFTKTIVFSGNAPAFLQLPIAQQRQQIEELFNITLLTEKAVLLRDQIKQTEGDIKVQEAVVKQQQVAAELHLRQVKEAELRVSRWEAQKIADIQQIEKTLTAIGQVDFEIEQLLHDERHVLQQENAYLAAKIAPIKKDVITLTSDLKKLSAEQAHLSEAKCPYCEQPFVNSDEKLSEISNKIQVKQKKLLELQNTLQELNSAAAEHQNKLSEIDAAITCTNLNELLAARANATSLNAKLSDLHAAVNPHIEALERLLEGSNKNIDTDKIDVLKKRLEHQQFLLKLLTNKDSFLRRKIISKTIPFLNDQINKYTRQLGLPHIVKFDADMSCTVSEFGRELDFGNLSAGEKKRVNTALALAFRDVLHHLHAKTNLLLIDELDGQLDNAGLDAVIRILKDKSRDEELCIFVISHHPSILGRLDRAMTVQKQHGFSIILE